MPWQRSRGSPRPPRPLTLPPSTDWQFDFCAVIYGVNSCSVVLNAKLDERRVSPRQAAEASQKGTTDESTKGDETTTTTLALQRAGRPAPHDVRRSPGCAALESRESAVRQLVTPHGDVEGCDVWRSTSRSTHWSRSQEPHERTARDHYRSRDGWNCSTCSPRSLGQGRPWREESRKPRKTRQPRKEETMEAQMRVMSVKDQSRNESSSCSPGSRPSSSPRSSRCGWRGWACWCSERQLLQTEEQNES